MYRVRFYLPLNKCNNDYRTVIWPIRYPYWCTGYTDTEAIIVAYVKDMDELLMQWPEMNGLEIDDCERCDKIEFSSRFARPDWYTNEHIKKMETIKDIKDYPDLYVYEPEPKKTKKERFVEKFGHWWYLRDLDLRPAPCEDYPKAFKMDGKWKTYGWAVYDNLEDAKYASDKARMALGLISFNDVNK